VVAFCLVIIALAGGDLLSAESKLISVKATGYCPCEICCGSSADGMTAMGRNAILAGVAVDPAVIPLGSHLDIPGYSRGPNRNGSWIKADDTGGAVKGFNIDVRFFTHEEALAWGVKHLTVRVWVKND